MKPLSSTTGVLYAIASSATFGLIPLFSIPLLSSGIGSPTILCYRFIVAAIIMAVVLLFTKRNLRLHAKQLGITLLLSVLYSLTAILLIESYEYIPSGVATTIHFLYPLAVTLSMSWLFGERTTTTTYIAVVVSLVDEDLLWDFYTRFYVDHTYDDGQRITNRDLFNAISGSDPIFRLEYVGKTTTSAANISSKYFATRSKAEQMLKVCIRAVDKSIVNLQREYDEFKVNVPIYQINDDGTVDVQIGLKEGVNAKSKYDVLMPEEDAYGRITYTKIGSLKPVKGQIWDNRFGAMEDAEALAADKKAKADDDAKGGNPYLTATTFKIVSGADRIVPGCLVREAKIKREK